MATLPIADDLITAAANNAPAMKREALDELHRAAFSLAISTDPNVDRATWRIIRDIYGAELDKRDTFTRSGCVWCGVRAVAMHYGDPVCAGHADMRVDTYK